MAQITVTGPGGSITNQDATIVDNAIVFDVSGEQLARLYRMSALSHGRLKINDQSAEWMATEGRQDGGATLVFRTGSHR